MSHDREPELEDTERRIDSRIAELLPLLAPQAKTALDAVCTLQKTLQNLDFFGYAGISHEPSGQDALDVVGGAASALRYVDLIARTITTTTTTEGA